MIFTFFFFFKAEQKSCMVWSFVSPGKFQRVSKLWDIQFYCCICRLAAGRPLRAEGTSPVPHYRVQHWSTRGLQTAAPSRLALLSPKAQLRGTIKSSSHFPDTPCPVMPQVNCQHSVCPSFILLAGKSVPKSVATASCRGSIKSNEFKFKHVSNG